MKPLHIQPGALNILVSSLEEGPLNLVAGKVYQAMVLEEAGEGRLLLQIGNRRVEAENQAGLQVGQRVAVLVREVNRGKIILQSLSPWDGETEAKVQGSSSVREGTRAWGLLERIFQRVGESDGGPVQGVESHSQPALQRDGAPSVFFPLTFHWSGLTFQGELALWEWGPDKAGPEEKSGAWRALLRLNSPALGVIEGDILFFNKELQIILKAQREKTGELLRDHLGELAQALAQAGLGVKNLTCRSEGRGEAGLDKVTPGAKGLDFRV